jgi:choline-sulfatase
MVNVVLITLDESNVSALHLYGASADTTPRLDALARDGVVFDRAFCTFPKCTPSRAALLSGRYPHTGGHRTIPGFELGADEDSLAKRLRAAGYRTAMAGKNHTVVPEGIAEHFDVRPEPRGQDVPWDRRPEETDDVLFRAFYRGDFSDIPGTRDHVTTDAALAFLTESADAPFFLLVNYNNPHPPYTDIEPFASRIPLESIVVPPRESLADAEPVIRAHREVYDLESLDDDAWRRIIRAYWSQVAFVDAEIGRVLDRLDELGLRDDTLVIVTADHGDFAGEHGCVEKWDTVFFDCLVRVPLLMRGPGVGESGRRIGTLTDNVDIVPTVLEICGQEVPADLHGRSLAPVLADASAPHKPYVFAEGGVEDDALTRMAPLDDPTQRKRHPNYPWKQLVMLAYPWTMRKARMIRGERWKLVYRVDGVKELYDLDADPGEMRNLTADPAHAAIAAELLEQLLAWSIRTEPDRPGIAVMQA